MLIVRSKCVVDALDMSVELEFEVFVELKPPGLMRTRALARPRSPESELPFFDVFIRLVTRPTQLQLRARGLCLLCGPRPLTAD